jgi:hypothetical protein
MAAFISFVFSAIVTGVLYFTHTLMVWWGLLLAFIVVWFVAWLILRFARGDDLEDIIGDFIVFWLIDVLIGDD